MSQSYKPKLRSPEKVFILSTTQKDVSTFDVKVRLISSHIDDVELDLVIEASNHQDVPEKVYTALHLFCVEIADDTSLPS